MLGMRWDETTSVVGGRLRGDNRRPRHAVLWRSLDLRIRHVQRVGRRDGRLLTTLGGRRRRCA